MTAQTTIPTAPPPTPAAAPRASRIGLVLSLTLLGLLLLMWLVLSFATDTFMTEKNIVNLLRQGAMVAIIAVGQTFVIITAGIDLSTGAVVGFASVAIAWLLVHGFGIASAIALTLLIGVAIGAFHGFGIVKLGLPPFIMTLASLTALRGFGLLITNGATISGLPDSFTDFSPKQLLGRALAFLDGRAGRSAGLYAAAAQPVGALPFRHRVKRRSGSAHGRQRQGDDLLRLYRLGDLSAFVGVLLAARIGIGNATQGEGWELQAIASSVIGGTSLFGAVGSVQGPLLGSFILTTINNGANLLNVNPFWQRIITGGLIIVIVYFDQLRRRGRR